MSRWLKKWKNIVADAVTGLGLFWLFIELASYLTAGWVDAYARKPILVLPALGVIISIATLKNKPKTSFVYQLRKKDNFIQVKVGDAFDNHGALIVPINDHFDLTLGGNVAKANSLQNKLIRDYYSNRPEHLENDIREKIQIGQPNPIGTTVEVENGGKKFYLLANSHRGENNRVRANIDDLLLALSCVWEYVGNESGRNKFLTIPLINSGHGRDASLTKMTTIKEIIDSYIESSKQTNVCEQLIISVHPDDVEKGLIKLDEVDEYLKSACHHYKQVFMAPRENDGGEPTRVIAIDN